MNARILLADDESDIRETVAYALRREGFEVTTADDGETALNSARRSVFAVVILDVMMPVISGLDVCRTLRGESDVPIIMLTARDAEVDRVLGLELGADDYLTKPFSIPELVSRIRAVLRRRDLDRASSPTTILELGGIQIDLTRHVVTVDGSCIQLTPSEFRVLALLGQEPGRVFSRFQIMEHLWDSQFVGDARACDVHISNLRRKVESDPGRPARIVTVREAGYKLVI